MGALFEGYEAARRKREALLAEHHRKEEDVDRHLHALADLINQDKDFMAQHGIACDVAQRVLHVQYNRSPVITAHYQPEDEIFRVTFMSDGSQVAPSTVEETAKAIGEMLFNVLSKR